MSGVRACTRLGPRRRAGPKKRGRSGPTRSASRRRSRSTNWSTKTPLQSSHHRAHCSSIAIWPRRYPASGSTLSILGEMLLPRLCPHQRSILSSWPSQRSFAPAKVWASPRLEPQDQIVRRRINATCRRILAPEETTRPKRFTSFGVTTISTYVERPIPYMRFILRFEVEIRSNSWCDLPKRRKKLALGRWGICNRYGNSMDLSATSTICRSDAKSAVADVALVEGSHEGIRGWVG